MPKLKNNKSTSASRKERSFQIRDMAMASSNQRQRDIDCWNMYNEYQDNTEFEYLTKVGDFDLPAQVRNVGKQRPKINLLSSQQTRRPFVFDVTTIDKVSLENKYSKKVHGLLDTIDEKLKMRHFILSTKFIELEQQQRQVSEYLQKQAESEEEMQRQEQLRQMMPQLNNQIDFMKSTIEEEQYFTDKELRNIKAMKGASKKQVEEILAQKKIHSLRLELDIKRKSVRNFINCCVTGKEYYYVDMIPGEKNPRFESLDTLKVYFPSTDSVGWVQKGPWVMTEEVMTYDAIAKSYGDKLTEDQLKDLEQRYLRNIDDGADFVATPDMGALLAENVYAGTKENNNGNGIRVYKIWYKIERKVFKKISENKHEPGKTFTHYIPEDKILINKSEYFYDNGYYFNKKDDTEYYPKERVETYSPRKGDEVETYYMDDRYKAVILDYDIYLDYGKDPIQPRTQDNWRDVLLPVVGYTYNSITHRPYSLIWSTKDLQKLYKIVSYHRELMLAVSGTRGNIMDMSQKPPDLSRDEWEYQMKIGRWYISSTDEDGRRRDTSFNQFPGYDHTVSQAIQFLDNILVSIDNEIGETMGISRPRLGQQVSTDKVGTNAQSQQMSELITEILYYDHDTIEAAALSQLINLHVKYAMSEDEHFEIFDINLNRDLVKIPKGKLSGVDFEVLVTDNNKQLRTMEELKQFAIRQNEKGQLPFLDLLTMWTSESLAEMQVKLEYFTEESQKLATKMAQQDQQNQQQLQRERIELDNKYKQFFEEQRNQLEKYKADLDNAQAKRSEDLEEKKQMLEKYRIDVDKNLRLMEIATEDKTESNMIKNQDKHQTIQEKLRAIELQMQHVLNYAQLEVQKDTDNKRHTEAMEKVKVEKQKAQTMGRKEHLVDN